MTGTNGKTTVAFLVRHLLGRKGPSRAIGTLGLVEESGLASGPGTEGLTTPGPVQISSWLREMVDDGVGSVALEASSHALAQHRLDGIRIDAAVFTNLSQDHLDYHADLDGLPGGQGSPPGPPEAGWLGGGEPGRPGLGQHSRPPRAGPSSSASKAAWTDRGLAGWVERALRSWLRSLN